MSITDYTNGDYTVSGTVTPGRADFFKLGGEDQRHIGTLISGSKTKLGRFEQDCHDIIDALAAKAEARSND